MPPSSTPAFFRLLLRLYPRAYRARYGGEMESLFRSEREASEGGILFWVRLTADHLEAAWAVRARKREGRMGRTGRWWDDGVSAWRSLRRSPGFTLFAVGTLALGVGSTAAVFTVVERVVLRPLPYPDSERMVRVGIQARMDPEGLGPLSADLLEALRERPGPAEEVVATRGRGAVLREGSDPERVTLTAVSPGFFPFFGARPALGRLLTPGDHAEGAEPVLLLSHAAWVERFGADPAAVGRPLRVDDGLRTVVGVLEESFLPPPEVVSGADFWVPFVPGAEGRGSFFLEGVARLRPGADPGAFDAHADAVVAEVYPADDGPGFLLGSQVQPYRESVVGPVGGTLARVLAAVALLLGIACVNVASLLLTRGAERRHELSVRMALGASRRRLVRKLLGESVFLAAAGGLLGAGLAWGAVELFRTRAPAGLPRLAEISLDGPGLAFAVGVSLVTVLFFGLLPALRAARDAGEGWAAPRGATLGRGERRLRSGLVVLETSLAVLLAVGSGLLAHDLARLAAEDAGFRSEGLAVMTLDLRPRIPEEEWASTWERLLEGTRALPGVTSAAVATQAPYDGTRMASTYRPEGWTGEDPVFSVTVAVGGDYLEALGASLAEGRALEPGDGAGEPVALVNEAFAREHWPGEAAVGKMVGSGQPDEPVYRVVGVMRDVHTRPGREASPHVFLPLEEAAWGQMEILARTEGAAAELAPGLREVVRRLDPALPVSRIRTVEGIARDSLASPRFYAGLFGGFALVALLLAVVGVYGTTAYATRARLREIGIRLALGARRGEVVAGVVARAGATVALGAALGLAVAAAASSRVLADTLRSVDPRNLPTYALVGAVVVAAGVVAAWLPAARAGRVDPATTLREE